MSTATTRTPRLLAAAKEFNIGKDTLLEYLNNKGFEINASNPNTKLTEEMYDALQNEFAQDRLAKRKSDEIALPKGSLLDNLKKNKDELDLGSRDKKKEEKAAEIIPEVKPKAEVQPEPVVVPAVAEKPEPVAEKPSEEVEPTHI